MLTFRIEISYNSHIREYFYNVFNSSDGVSLGRFLDETTLQRWKELMRQFDSNAIFIHQKNLFTDKHYNFFVKSHTSGFAGFEDVVKASTPQEAVDILKKRWTWLKDNPNEEILSNLQERKG